MVKQKRVRLTKAEMEVMKAFWKLGRTSIREIQENFPAKRRPAYTTVCTVVYRLEAKGAVRRVRKIGNAGIFEPIITPEAAHRRIVDEFLEFFGGSVRPLMAHLVESRKVTMDDLRFMENALLELEENNGSQKSEDKSSRTATHTKSAAQTSKRKPKRE